MLRKFVIRSRYCSALQDISIYKNGRLLSSSSKSSESCGSGSCGSVGNSKTGEPTSSPSGGCNKQSSSTPSIVSGRLDSNANSPPGQDEENDYMIEMVCDGPSGLEWGGPRKGGRFPEPTRYGDWEQKGRVTDF